jgi:hypothetical protein
MIYGPKFFRAKGRFDWSKRDTVTEAIHCIWGLVRVFRTSNKPSTVQDSITMSQPDSPRSQASKDHPEDEDAEMLDADQDDQEDEEEQENPQPTTSQDQTRSPREHRKDKDLNSFLNQMDKYAPIVPPEPFPLIRYPTQSQIIISPSLASNAVTSECKLPNC